MAAKLGSSYSVPAGLSAGGTGFATAQFMNTDTAVMG